MELEPHSIEKRDFPLAPRGYEPSAVDEHLREIAAAVAQLRGETPRGQSVGTSAANEVREILEAAEAAAKRIREQASEAAAASTAAARQQAGRAEGEVLADLKSRVASVARASEAVRQQLDRMDAELEALTAHLDGGEQAGRARAQQGVLAASRVGTEREAEDAADGASVEEQASGQSDGARLVALNMALNGDSREATERYLAEHFELPDRNRLIDEVYAAVEG